MNQVQPTKVLRPKLQKHTSSLLWFFLGILPPLFFVAFLHLDITPVGMYDEALYGLRALFMAQDGSYLYDFSQIDPVHIHPNTKPPLFTVVQAVFLKALGPNHLELALRLPVALFVLLTVVLLSVFCYKAFQNLRLAFIVALVLMTTQGYMAVHVARSGDHDAVVAFFNTWLVLSFYGFVHTSSYQNRYLWMALTAFLGCVFVKGVMAGFFIPALLIYGIYNRKILALLKNKAFWIGSAVGFLLIVIHHLFMEHQHEGFLLDLWQGELFGRYTQTIDIHQHGFFYYLNKAADYLLTPWIFFLPLSFALLLQKGNQYRSIALLLVLCIFSYWLIISFSQTKLLWYMASLYPLVALLVGMSLERLWSALEERIKPKPIIRLLSFLALVFAIFYQPYRIVAEKSYLPKLEWKEEKYGYLMRRQQRHNPALNTYSVVHRENNYHMLFYTKAYNGWLDYEITTKRYPANFVEGEVVLVCDGKILREISSAYTLEQLDKQDEDCALVRLLKKKP